MQPIVVQQSTYDIFSPTAAWVGGIVFVLAGFFRAYQAWRTKDDPAQRGFLRRTAVAYVIIGPIVALTPFIGAGVGLPALVSAVAFVFLIEPKKPKK